MRQPYASIPELDDVLETFKGMVNYCIRVGLERNITSRFRLSAEVYQQLHSGLHTWYILSAIEKATTILRNYRKAKRRKADVRVPYVRKPFLSIGNQAYRLVDGGLRLPVKPRQFVFISLNRHTLEVLSDPGLKFGSVTLTASTVSISFSKETAEIEPTGYMGLDRNLDNVTTCNTDGEVERYDLSKATGVKSVYCEVKSRFSRNDARVRRRIFRKYGEKERNRVNQILHHTSKEIVERAKDGRLGIVMENLKGIRRLYRRGNGQGRRYRGRMNSWSYAELQWQVNYKARWEGIPIIYVDARGTSRYCSICGSRLYPNEQCELWCPICRMSLDRDVNAARNILARGMRFVPHGSPNEAMVSEPEMVLREVDGEKPNLGLTDPRLDRT